MVSLEGKCKKNIYMKSVLLLEVGLAICLFAFETHIVFKIGMIECIKFLAFQLLAIIIPGLALTYLQIKSLSVESRFCLAYLWGYGINIIEYFIVELFDRKLSHVVLVTVVFVISLIILARRRKERYSHASRYELSKGTMILITCFAVLFAVNILAYACRYKDEFSLPHDMSWWVNNSVALKLKFTPDNLFMAGTGLSYHYFSSMQIAFCSLVTGIDIVALSIPFFAVTKTIIIVCAVYFMLDVLEVNDRTKLFGMVICLFTTGYEARSIVTYFSHIVLLPFGFDIGYAFGILFLAFLYMQWKKDIFDWGIWISTMLSWGICVGSKAPIAAVLIAQLGMLCLFWLIKKDIKTSLLYGGGGIIVFLSISIFCVGMLSVAKGDSNSYYLALHSYKDLCMFSDKEYPVLVALIIRWVCMNPTLACFVSISSFKFIYCIVKNKVRSDDIMLICATLICYLWGLFLWRIIQADGNSEMYYGMASNIPAYLFVMLVYKHTETTAEKWKTSVNTGIKSIEFVTCLIGVLLFCFHAYDNSGAIRTSVYSIKDMRAIIDIGTQEMDALRWIRDNTSLDSIVVSDYATMTETDTCYYYGIVSERQQYIEGVHMLRFGNQNVQDEIERRKALVECLYYNDYSALQTLKDEGVDYVVQTVDITPMFANNEEYLEKVASSERINVYRIK